MQIKDLSMSVERMEDVRGGSAYGQQNIYNGATFGASGAFGGGVDSDTTSKSLVFAGHTNNQGMSVKDIYKRTSSVNVKGSQNVWVTPGFAPYL